MKTKKPEVEDEPGDDTEIIDIPGEDQPEEDDPGTVPEDPVEEPEVEDITE